MFSHNIIGNKLNEESNSNHTHSFSEAMLMLCANGFHCHLMLLEWKQGSDNFSFHHQRLLEYYVKEKRYSLSNAINLLNYLSASAANHIYTIYKNTDLLCIESKMSNTKRNAFDVAKSVSGTALMDEPGLTIASLEVAEVKDECVSTCLDSNERYRITPFDAYLLFKIVNSNTESNHLKMLSATLLTCDIFTQCFTPRYLGFDKVDDIVNLSRPCMLR